MCILESALERQETGASQAKKFDYDELMRLCLEKGFFFPSAEIYNDAPAGFWDYGPLGLLMRENVVREWRRSIVRYDDMLEIDGAVILPKVVFEASGHLRNLVDPIVECTRCHTKLRADRYISEKTGLQIDERLSSDELQAIIAKYELKCPNCGGELGKPARFNMMFRVGVGAEDADAYLRPETAQSIFVDFSRISKTMRFKLPKGVAQVGRSFRNEIAPRQGLIRLRELLQAEVEVFFNPEKEVEGEKFRQIAGTKMNLVPHGSDENAEVIEVTAEESIRTTGSSVFSYYLALLQRFYDRLGFEKEDTRFRELSPSDRAFYTTKAFDFEVRTSLGWLELVACNYRTDYDLANHGKASGKDLSIMDDEEAPAKKKEKNNNKMVPHVVELSIGVDRTMFSLLDRSYFQEPNREVLRLKANVSPYLAAVFPLVSKDQFEVRARSIYEKLKRDEEFAVFYDDSGAIGRRYRRMDQVGTPYCITVDDQTLKDGTVTLRERDGMKQERFDEASLGERLRRLRLDASEAAAGNR
jgi:glycyl-tRNA synthetase